MRQMAQLSNKMYHGILWDRGILNKTKLLKCLVVFESMIVSGCRTREK
jgi:hypothetical protein